MSKWAHGRDFFLCQPTDAKGRTSVMQRAQLRNRKTLRGAPKTCCGTGLRGLTPKSRAAGKCTMAQRARVHRNIRGARLNPSRTFWSKTLSPARGPHMRCPKNAMAFETQRLATNMAETT